LDNTAQTVKLTPQQALRNGRHEIHIAYHGKIYDDPYGLFRVSYDQNGHTVRALATQFEPGDARRLAPMWDQPNRRAIFSLTITAPAGQMAVSNMPVANSATLPTGRVRVTFADTPPMASYLVFLAVGDFERITQTVDGVEVGVVVRRGETERARYALQAGVESLHYYHDYFGIPYPLPKLDMVGVPGAGGFAAMENWGAILYFDQYILLDADRSSEANRQDIFNTIAHEIAHQWFGDLVTMEWWNDLWLNEGFASWMAAKATNALHPDWKPWLGQLTDGTASAMSLDSREGTHPVVQEVNTIDEANLAFDAITYQKGLAVLRMVEAYVGEDAFRTGVHNYLMAHRLGNAETNDLWTAVQQASGQPVLEIAHSFTNQPGFPVLTVSGANCSTDRPTVSVAQRRFAMDDAARTDEHWSVPVVARRVGAAPVRGVLPPQATASIQVPPGCGAYIVNAGQSGFFRVLYDQQNFQRLVQSFHTLDTDDQLGILLDYWAFGRSGDAPFTNYLDLTTTLPADADPVIALDTVDSMTSLAAYAEGRPSEQSVRAYARNAIRPFFTRIGWDPKPGEPANDAILRAKLISALGDLGDAEVIAGARQRFGALGGVPASIRDAVIHVYAYNATPQDYDTLVAQARAATDFVEQRRLWLAAATAKNPDLARRSLDLTLQETLPRQLRPQVLLTVAGEQPRMAWDFLVAHRQALEAMFDPLSRFEYPASIASQSSDPAMVTELETYAHGFPAGVRPSITAATASIRIKAQTIHDRMPAVEQWIARRSADPAPVAPTQR
jgi:aminopeptidase N